MFRRYEPKADSRRIVPGRRTKEYCHNEVTNSKYTPLTFLPLNLYEQFGRPLNMYFLIVALLQFIRAIAPVNPLSTILPLLLAFSLTAAKEGYDDYKRHKEDNVFNKRRYERLCMDGTFETIESCDIHVGDIIRVSNGDEIPCDLMLLTCSDPEGFAYIRTDNLDGEIDLKARCCLEVLVGGDPVAKAMHFSGTIVCDPPDAHIYRFDSRVERENTASLSVSSEQLLLQSSFLQNTDFVIGVAVYTGNQTKCGMNKSAPPIKWADVDKRVSRYSIVVFCFQIALAIAMGATGLHMKATEGKRAWYLAFVSPAEWYDHLIIPTRFFLLTTVMIPISFKVIIDISKYYISLAVGWDIKMYDPEIDAPAGCPAKANNSAIAEDLGQIQYIMTDKTGTLTENCMEFKVCSIANTIWGGGDAVRSGAPIDPAFSAVDDTTLQGKVKEVGSPEHTFFMSLALCHTVAVKHHDGKKELNAASPDEEGLVKAAGYLGIHLTDRTKNEVVVQDITGDEVRYDIVHVFEFTSDRKMMSILLQGKDGKLHLLSKGADDRIIPLLGDDPGELDRHLTLFASAGLRTLVVGRREVAVEEYEKWQPKLQRALEFTGEQRAVEVSAVYKELEKDLKLVGATAIEDRLQEDVPKTIHELRQAGISFWMLTGDKFETAKQIAIACRLWEGEELLHLHGGTDDDIGYELARLREVVLHDKGGTASSTDSQVRRSVGYGTFPSVQAPSFPERFIPGSRRAGLRVELVDVTTQRRQPGYCLIVDGKTLQVLLTRHYEEFAGLCFEMNSVICCRVSPSQKATVTRMVQTAFRPQSFGGWFLGNTGYNKVLGIGDGGNDVSMIQAATIGVGIVGKEGRQASRAADFSIARFRFLRPLLLVHGHYSYYRSCYIAQYCFYKSMLIAIIQMVYNFWTLFSGVSYWNSMLLTMWNGMFTLPAPFLYVLDRHLPRDVLLSYPKLYQLSQRGTYLTGTSFLGFLVRGQLQGVVALLFTLGIFSGDYVSVTGDVMGFGSIFTITYTALIFVQSWTLVLESNTITVLNALAIFGMPLVYLLFLVAYTAIPRFEYYTVAFHLFADPAVFFAVVLIVVVLMLPHHLYVAWTQNFSPSLLQRAKGWPPTEQERQSSFDSFPPPHIHERGHLLPASEL